MKEKTRELIVETFTEAIEELEHTGFVCAAVNYLMYTKTDFECEYVCIFDIILKSSFDVANNKLMLKDDCFTLIDGKEKLKTKNAGWWDYSRFSRKDIINDKKRYCKEMARLFAERKENLILTEKELFEIEEYENKI